MKKRIWQIHSWLGLICGLGLILVGLTGSVLVFQKEINSTLYADTNRAEYTADAQRLPLGPQIAKVQAAFPDFWVSGWLLNRNPESRDIAYMKPRGTDDWHKLRVDQYTGEIPGKPLGYRDTLQGWFVDLHYTLFADHIGMAITAVFALGLIALSVTGIWIYRSFWKNLFRLRFGKSLRIFCSDLHKMIGIVTVPLNLILGVTGTYWNISHLAHELVEHADEEEHRILNPQEAHLPVEQLVKTATDEWNMFRINYIYFPTDQDPNIYFYGSNHFDSPFLSPYGSWMGIDSQTGEIAITEDLREAGLWSLIVDSFEPFHFGDFGGLFTKIIWCFAGLAPGILAISGSLIYFSRRERS
ncbi:PepSY-associated TM helix domain-containing protein [Pelagicoccus sp. SDUM812002]|uniref:PepSY-associated TM helix domain-containing protein n=1 Tax=Pelagicoccus sp. SDUM812002 TaxID=3041266 RepID=UPI00280D4521|nr:PepSY-associated TM helix domain-containing protein [Pelagicoccus sp. SDUM812002]MDQ8184835.1 PepSY-associated TM helix domain-containing protein [Pelagicoccus sp. SDUM812002]